MKLSIITINFNNFSGLQKTIDSVISQICKDFEWVIIDGGSTDGSCELIEKNADNVSCWISEPDRGIYNAMNKGIRLSHGEYLLFLNSGDYLYDCNVIQNALPLLEGYDFVVGKEKRNDLNCIWDLPLSTTEEIFRVVNFYFIPHQSTFIARKVFNEYGLYREDIQLSSDWYMYYKALMLGNATVCRIPYMVAVFAGNGVTCIHKDLMLAERPKIWSEIPRIKYVVDFYFNNYDIIKALKANRFLFFIFRVYYYMYRHLSKH